MRYVVTAISLLFTLFLKAQENYSADKQPVFKQVTHPFMPPITSEYIFFSEDGLLWFSTAQGLTSFDGSEVTYYSSVQQSNNFQLYRINAMAEDKNHNFYLGTPIGLYYYNRKTGSFTTLAYTFTDIHKTITIAYASLYYDNNGLLYAGSGSQGLFIYNEKNNQFSHYNLDPSKPDSWEDRRLNTVSSFAKHATDSNKLWVGTFHGIYLFDKKNKTVDRRFEIINPAHHLPGSSLLLHFDIQKMDVENDSTVWFNSWTGGFGKYNTNTGKAKLFLQEERVQNASSYIGFVMPKFAKLSNGKYLLGIYDDKTAIFDTRSETVIYFHVTPGDFPEETRFVVNDKKGNLWLLQKGFLYATVPAVLHLQSVIVPNLTEVSFSKPALHGIYFDTSANKYYGAFTASVGVHVFDSNFLPVTVFPTGVVNTYFSYKVSRDYKITKDGTGRFWTAGLGNYILLPENKKFELIEKKFPSLTWLKTKGEFYDVITSRNGDILLKKNGGLIYSINHTSLVVDTIRCPAIKADGVEIYQTPDWYDTRRDIVYLTRNEGIAQYHLSKREMKVIPYKSLFGNLPSNQGICISALDAEGRIWFMIPKYGIRIIDPETLNCIDSIPYGNRGLMRGDYTRFTGTTGNYILLRSQNGIVVYDFAKQQSFLFDHSNGLSSPDNRSLLYCNGYMIIGQSGRFEYFKLSGLDNYTAAVKPYLNSVKTDTSFVFIRAAAEPDQSIKLSYHQNTVSFSFSVPEFFFPERIEYAYQLLPVDKEWHYTNYFNRKIIYSKLSPGSYTFRLKAQMQGGSWNSEPVEYSIIISPAWWQTRVFKIGLYVLIASLVIGFARWRIRTVRKQEQAKAQMEKQMFELEAKALRAQMNPHFIFNSLNSIKSLIQQNENEKSVIYLTTFSKLIRNLFNNADKKEISLYDEIETCKLYLELEAMRFDTKFSYSVSIDKNIDLKSIHVPALIIQPFIENAIWHGMVPRNNGGNISLNVVRKEEFIEIIIDDDGIGREASAQNKSASVLAHQSKGVNLTQTRLELNNLLQQRQAVLETIDKKDEQGNSTGTTVIIKIKEELS